MKIFSPKFFLFRTKIFRQKENTPTISPQPKLGGNCHDATVYYTVETQYENLRSKSPRCYITLNIVDRVCFKSNTGCDLLYIACEMETTPAVFFSSSGESGRQCSQKGS